MRHVNGASFQVLGDEEDLKAMVSNLVDNAIKLFRPQVHVAVELEQAEPRDSDAAGSRSGHRHLAVRAQAHLQALLPHSRRDEHRASRAPASGSSSSARSSPRHGGKVFVESDGAGQGHVHRSRCQLPSSVARAMSRILVVEDEQHLADGLRYQPRGRAPRRRSSSRAAKRRCSG